VQGDKRIADSSALLDIIEECLEYYAIEGI
jgi:hypothetical protein